MTDMQVDVQQLAAARAEAEARAAKAANVELRAAKADLEARLEAALAAMQKNEEQASQGGGG